MSRVLETGIKEQQKYEKRKQTYVDNTLNDLHHKSLKIVKKRKIPFLIKQDISFFFFNENTYSYSWKSTFLRFLRIQLPRHFFC